MNDTKYILGTRSRVRDYARNNRINPAKVVCLDSPQAIAGLRNVEVIELKSSYYLTDIVELKRVLKHNNCEIIQGK